RLELADPSFLALGQVAEVSAARELPELADPPVAVHALPEPDGRVERRQVLVALVDGLDRELVLQAREMEVVLLQHPGLEAIGPVPVGLEGRFAREWIGHRRRI